MTEKGYNIKWSVCQSQGFNVSRTKQPNVHAIIPSQSNVNQFSIPLIPQRLCRPRCCHYLPDLCELQLFSFPKSFHLPFTLQSLYHHLPHPCLCCVGKLDVFSKMSIKVFTYQLFKELPLPLSPLIFSFFWFYLSGTSEPQSTRPHNSDKWNTFAMEAPCCPNKTIQWVPASIHGRQNDWMPPFCDWSIQPHTVATRL